MESGLNLLWRPSPTPLRVGVPDDREIHGERRSYRHRAVRPQGLDPGTGAPPMALNFAERFAASRSLPPSPVHKPQRLSRELQVEVWAKRDDVSSGLAFGGNKVRKLEWLAADALAQGCDSRSRSETSRATTPVSRRCRGRAGDEVPAGRGGVDQVGRSVYGKVGNICSAHHGCRDAAAGRG